MQIRRGLRILEVVHAFLPDSCAGTELYTYNLSLALERLGHRVSVLYPVDSDDGEHFAVENGSHRGLSVMRFHRKKSQTFIGEVDNPALDAPFAKLLQSFDFDLVHFQHLTGLSLSLLAVVRKLGIPCALKIDDMFFYCTRQHLANERSEHCHGGPESLEKCVDCIWGGRWQDREPRIAAQRFGEVALRRSLMLQAIQVPDYVHFASEFVARDARKHGLIPRRGEVVHTGIAPFVGERREPRGARLRVGYMGAIHERKGIQFFLTAVLRFLGPRQQAGRASELDFFVWGSESGQRGLYQKLCDAAAAVDHLEYKGPFCPDDLGTIFAQLDVLVVPSTGENYPFVIREALWAGVPVVATRIAGIPEIIREGENGWLVEPGDPNALLAQFERLAAQPDRVDRIVIDRAAIKTIDQEARELADVFGGLVATASEARSGDPIAALLQQGRERIERGEHWEALCIFGDARSRYGDQPQILLGLGVASFHLGNPERAFELLLDAQAIAPLDADIAVSLGLAAEKIGRLGELADALAAASEATPQDDELGRLSQSARRAKS